VSQSPSPKTDPSRSSPFAPIVLHALELYVGERTSGPIFLNADGSDRLSYSTSYALIRRLAKRADIAAAARISPHSLRHSFRDRAARRRRATASPTAAGGTSATATPRRRARWPGRPVATTRGQWRQTLSVGFRAMMALPHDARYVVMNT
jgi:integrase